MIKFDKLYESYMNEGFDHLKNHKSLSYQNNNSNKLVWIIFDKNGERKEVSFKEFINNKSPMLFNGHKVSNDELDKVFTSLFSYFLKQEEKKSFSKMNDLRRAFIDLRQKDKKSPYDTLVELYKQKKITVPKSINHRLNL
jgi:hypothetical protein